MLSTIDLYLSAVYQQVDSFIFEREINNDEYIKHARSNIRLRTRAHTNAGL